MILSRASLAVVDVASTDPHRRALNSVHIAADGSTVASDGRTLLAVSPVDAAIVNFPLSEHVSPPEDGVCVDLEIIRLATKNLPSKPANAQYTAITRCDRQQVELTCTDLRKQQRVSAAPVRERFPEWREVLANAAAKTTQSRVCLDRKCLQALLRTIDNACGARDQEAVVFLELGGETNAILLRAENRMTGQRVVGMMAPMQTHGKWLRPTPWERRVLGRDVKRKDEEREEEKGG